MPRLTVGSFFWHDYMTEIRLCGERNSDVVSFHSYGNLHEVRERLDELEQYGRPVLCTEWLARHHGSKFASHLPLFRERNVGVYQWGLVAGRTQTWLHWYTRYSPEPEGEPRLWLHDVIRPDGSLFDPAEADALREHAGQDLALEPVPMTAQLMAHLEELGLIIRLRPGGHDLAAQPGETLDESIYETADRYGPHKLIAVTVNRAEFAAFGTHPDNEEFLLLANPDSQLMYLAVALCLRDEFKQAGRARRTSRRAHHDAGTRSQKSMPRWALMPTWKGCFTSTISLTRSAYSISSGAAPRPVSTTWVRSARASRQSTISAAGR